MSCLSGRDGGTNKSLLAGTVIVRVLGFYFPHSRISHQSQLFSNVVFVLHMPLDCEFPWYYTFCSPKVEHLATMSSLSGHDGGTNNPSCRSPYRQRCGFLFLKSRISHQSELSCKSLPFSAVVQNTRRRSLLRKLGDRLDLITHGYQVNAPISHRLIWPCALLYPSLATSAAQIRYAAQMSGVGTLQLQGGLST
jgi:hypothetical protein